MSYDYSENIFVQEATCGELGWAVRFDHPVKETRFILENKRSTEKDVI